MRVLSRGRDDHTALLAGQQQALRNQLHQSEQLLKQSRLAELTEAGALPFQPPTDDSRQLARAWLGRYLSDEKEALVHDIATAAGVPAQEAAPIRSIRDKITKCIDSGWITTPVSDTVQQLLTLDDHAFRRCLIEDASRQNARDDALCHPLVLNRWRDQLNAAIAALAPAAENPTTRHLHDRNGRKPPPRQRTRSAHRPAPSLRRPAAAAQRKHPADHRPQRHHDARRTSRAQLPPAQAGRGPGLRRTRPPPPRPVPPHPNSLGPVRNPLRAPPTADPAS
ncbi:hypothetical protein YUYDRAFT_07111 [Streptomyces sp. ScaeMP-e48]|nr:hypothetical protein YUYDRAFT_07111 [Streptomyces sp. ScaeMP-e48]